MSQVLTVFGATGNQGGSIIKHVLAHPELSKKYKIRAITRDVSKPAAVSLKEKGAEVVSANLDDKETVFKAIEGSSVVAAITNYWESIDPEIEINQGKNIVDAAKAANVDRLIFSSMVNVTKETHGKLTTVKHFDSKATIEEYARSKGVPGTYYMPAIFDSFFVDFFKKNDQGEYTLSMPIDKNVKIPLIDIESDAGLFVSAILLQLPETLNKRISASGDPVTPVEAVSIFTDVTGKKAAFNKISWDAWHSIFPPNMAEDMVGNWQLVQDGGYFAGESADSIEQGHTLVAKAGLRKPISWRQFLGQAKIE